MSDDFKFWANETDKIWKKVLLPPFMPKWWWFTSALLSGALMFGILFLISN